MNPRIAVALPVLPALAHAATLRWAAADLVPDDTFGGWSDVIDGAAAGYQLRFHDHRRLWSLGDAKRRRS